MRFTFLHPNVKKAGGGIDGFWGIPFVIARDPVVQVDGFPEGVVARPEGSTVDVELVAKDEVEVGAVGGVFPCVLFAGVSGSMMEERLGRRGTWPVPFVRRCPSLLPFCPCPHPRKLEG